MSAEGNRSQADRFSDERPVAAAGFDSVALRVREVVEFASYFVAAQTDRLKLTALNVAMFIVIGAVAAFVGTGVVLTAGVLLVVGTADGLGILFGGRFWLGDLTAAVVIIGVLFVGTLVVFKKVIGSSRGKLVAAYEQRKSQQRSDLGTDVGVESHR